MRLIRLTLTDFRNFVAAELEPHPRFNVLTGENGQGKTNLLESIYWLATLRPFRAARLVELTRWDASATRVAGAVDLDHLEHRLEVRLESRARVAFREDHTVRAADYFGALAVVLFTPADVGLVRATPQIRRRYLDRAIFTERPGHLATVNSYRKALEARNRLLREQAADALLEAHERPLADRGARLIAARRDYIDRLAPRFETAYHAIAGDTSAIRLVYAPDLDADADALNARWGADRHRDRERGFTQRGPHADDLQLSLLARSARAYASQGQQRSMVLALKIAEIQLLEAFAGITPVLLLDDVSSELDRGRNARLFEFLQVFDGQTFITTTDAGWLQLDSDGLTFDVRAGTVQPAAGAPDR